MNMWERIELALLYTMFALSVLVVLWFLSFGPLREVIVR